MIYDVTVAITNTMPVWPGDPPLKLTPESRLSRDGTHTVRLTAIDMGSHTGTHIDAPYHFVDGGRRLDEIPLDVLIGPATVHEILHVGSIGPAQLEPLNWAGTQRVLFKTENSKHWNDGTFYQDFVYLEPEGAKFLVERGVSVVGIDYLSIDKFHSQKHPTHFVLLERNVVIIVGLNLNSVKPGRYQMVALPLNLKDADGAPTRVILVDE